MLEAHSHIWDIPELIEDLPEITKNLIPIPIALLVAIFFHNVLSSLVYQFTSKTETELDDIAFQHLRLPVTIFIVYLGVVRTVSHMQFTEDLKKNIESFFLSIVIGFWCTGFWKAFNQILEDRKIKREQQNKSTQLFPLFNLIGKAFKHHIPILVSWLLWNIPPYSTIASASIVGIALHMQVKIP